MVKKSLLGCIVMGILLALLSAAFPGDAERDDLIFSHRFHVEEMEMTCLACHSAAEESVLSSDRLFPTMETCGECHEIEEEAADASKSECATCHTKPEEPEAVPTPVRTIHFPHKRHLAPGRIECLSCHVGVERSEALEQARKRQRGYTPPMEVCARCHEGELAAGGCSLCHVAVDTLRPTSHDDDWDRGHRWFVRAGDETCAMCHQDRYCAECHEPGALVRSKEAPKDVHAAFAPRLGDGANMALEGVHDLNTRYTHPLDLKGKERNCSTCHETSSCVACHRPEGERDPFKPAWHGGDDWGAGAGDLGTGGGRHAELAEKDIERCAACHDTQGADPICLLCHMDRTPGQGNDPRTHDAGFADNMEHGPWHEDEGWVCYNCHLHREGPEGFCQYCHGGK